MTFLFVPLILSTCVHNISVRLVSFGIITATASVAAKFILKKLDSELIELEETVTKAWSNTNLNIENEDYRSFCRRFDDERVVVKRPIPLRNLPKAGITYGVYVPLDEEKFPILFQCDSYDWKECCRPYFGIDLRQNMISYNIWR